MKDATVEIYGESIEVKPQPSCKPDCQNRDAQIRLVLDAAVLLRDIATGEPSIEKWAALADLQRRAAGLSPCPHCNHPPPPAPKRQGVI